MTVAEYVRDAAATLAGAGHPLADSRVDVSVLARHVLGWDPATWLMRQTGAVPDRLRSALPPLVARRAAGEPVAYLTGEKEFYGRSFVVSPAVLIPRPETELVIEVAGAHLDRIAAMRAVQLIDVGTGSGCLAVTLAAEHPGARVIATDVSAEALEVAATNAQHHGVASRIEARNLPGTAGARDVDMIVTNPPYVPARDREMLPRDVRDYEPAVALFGGEDGLEIIRQLLPAARDALRPDGILVMEIGDGQFDEVRQLLAAAGLAAIRPHRDLAGIIRVVEAARHPDSV